MTHMNLLFAILGLVTIALSVPLLLRRVPPNPVYGLRVPATFKDEQVWYDANAACGRDLLLFGVVIAVLAVVLPVAGVRDMMLAVTWAVVTGVGGMVVAVIGWARANRMLRERQEGRG